MNLFNPTGDIWLNTYWYVALTASLIFVIQMILTLTGIGSDSDINSDGENSMMGESSLLEFFTIRNVVNFALGFGWGGISFYSLMKTPILSFIAAIICGVIFVALFFYLIKTILKLEENNTFDIQSIIGMTAEVYLKIPSEGSEDYGIIQCSIKGSMRELNAKSVGESIPTGAKVEVKGLTENGIAIVQQL